MSRIYQSIRDAHKNGQPLLAVLIDPEEVQLPKISQFIDRLPKRTTHIFVGGSTVAEGMIDPVVKAIKAGTHLPVLLFPGSFEQVSAKADGILFLSLLSGRNPEFLIGQQVKAVAALQQAKLEVIPTAYLLIDGGTESAVARVTETRPMPPSGVEAIVHTAKAGEFMGAKMVYLEAGAEPSRPSRKEVIQAVC